MGVDRIWITKLYMRIKHVLKILEAKVLSCCIEIILADVICDVSTWIRNVNGAITVQIID